MDITAAPLPSVKESNGARLRRLCAPGVARPERLDFSGVDLSGADLSGVNASGVIFRGAKLVGTKLYGSVLKGADFREADLIGADLRRCIGHRANFARAKLSGALLCRAQVANACFVHASFGWAGIMARPSLEVEDKLATEPKEYDPAWAEEAAAAAAVGHEEEDKEDAAEMEAWRAVVKARFPQFVEGIVDLNRAVIAHSKLQGVALMGAHMRRASLRFSMLQGIDDRPTGGEDGRATLICVDLRGANLTWANFTNASIHSSRLDATTDMDGAEVTGTSFKNSSFGAIALPSRREARPPASAAFWARLLCTSVAKQELGRAVAAARGESERVAKAIEAAAATASPASEIEPLLTAELKRLLERFATRLKSKADAATGAEGDVEDDASGAAIAGVVEGAIDEVRSTVERRAAPIVHRCAGAIAQAVAAAPLLPRRAPRLGRPLLRVSPPIAGGAAKVSPQAELPQAKGEAEPEATERTPLVTIGTTAQICREQLDSLFDQLDACLAEPAELLRSCAVGAGAHLLRKAGFARRLGSLGKRAAALAEKTRGRLEGSEELKGAVSDSQLEAREKLTKLEEGVVTEQGWLDLYESWVAVLVLRSKMEDECAQQVLCAIVSDDRVLGGLAAAHVLRDTRFDAGKPPEGLLLQLKQGPVKHMKSHAYRYQRKIGRELARIARIQTLQQRAIGLLGTLIISTSIGISNFVSNRVYEVVYGDSSI